MGSIPTPFCLTLECRSWTFRGSLGVAKPTLFTTLSFVENGRLLNRTLPYIYREREICIYVYLYIEREIYLYELSPPPGTRKSMSILGSVHSCVAKQSRARAGMTCLLNAGAVGTQMSSLLALFARLDVGLN